MEWEGPHNHHRLVTIALVLLNLAAIAYALYLGGPGRWDHQFRQVSLITWLGSAQMLGAALLFLACYFAGSIIRVEGEAPRDNHTWLVFALGFFVLAIDQQFLLREQLTAAIDRVPLAEVKSGGTAILLKTGFVAIAVTLVLYYRATVLANFSMVVAFIGGFWFLLVVLLAHMVVESIGLPAWLGQVLQGSGKLLAMAMFLSGSYIVLLDRLSTAQAAALRSGDRRKRQLPITFPDRRGRVEFRPIVPGPSSPLPQPVRAATVEEGERLSPLDQPLAAPPVEEPPAEPATSPPAVEAAAKEASAEPASTPAAAASGPGFEKA